jgi:hypothetical protein
MEIGNDDNQTAESRLSMIKILILDQSDY